MNVGDYVRTNKGTIDKITEDNIIDYKISLLYEGEKVDNWSENIIDLIEVGDYVNGYKVLNVYYDEVIESIRVGIDHQIIKDYTNQDIKSILTKEQFESMEYKL